jgi:hypothetical protein
MNCLNLYQIHQYLENELTEPENSSIREHIAHCPHCKHALEDRQTLLQAVESLPYLETPPDFTQQVISQIFPQTIPLARSLATAVAGSCAIFLTTIIIFIASGQNLVNVLMAMNQSVLNSIKHVSVFSAKLIKLAFLFVRIIIQLAGYLLNSLTHMSTVLGPEFQAFLVFITLLISGTLVFGLRRKLFLGEKP